ncbi:hypothetical protein [uncultured Bdellovibrio sp.]|uniref:hypothetical protein n=1 Tax=Bdellovibrio sp. HCB-162 TaxID=3394234 RepID=UPI0025CCD526|nr:hypothetical protein [uncultured Bdellovibrio sp.]
MTTKDSLYSESSIFWDQNKTATTDRDLSAEDFLEKVKADIRQNYQFALFSILPGLASDPNTLKKLSKKLGIDPVTANDFSYRLLRAGLWTVTEDRIETNFEFLNLGDISVKDYLAMTVSIISHLSDSKSYEYDTLSVVTNRGLIRNFIVKVNQSLKELHEKSHEAGVVKDCLFSWSHTGVIELEHNSQKDNEQ